MVKAIFYKYNCLKFLSKERHQDLLMLPFGREQQIEIQFETQL